MTLRVPECAYVVVAVTPVAEPSGNRSRFQEYDLIDLSSADVEASKVHVRLVHDEVNLATGSASTMAVGSNCLLILLFSPCASVAVSVTLRSPPCGYVVVTIFPV